MPLEVLRRYFGYSQFRKGQQELIEAQLSGRDAFGIMPTGGGKSICYQVPAMLLPGITLVVSPLISLMKDQVMALKNAGIPAAFINSSLTLEQIWRVYGNLRRHIYKLVYIAPERLLTDGFLEVAQELEISLLAVDEAHCISQWGQDFRPSYMKIPEFLERLPRRPVVSAFTATATEQVRRDVERILQLRDPCRVVTGFDRPNLCFGVLRPKDKMDCLLGLLSKRKGKCGIVYCSTRKDTESVCQVLRDRGYSAACYHAGLEDGQRRQAQEDFVFDRCQIMVATNAFGMGIDKSNVSFVIHYNMPKSLEAYYQEAGRAGRDGEKAECLLLFAPKDVMTAKYLIQHPSENEELDDGQREAVIAQDMIRLNTMVGYCRTENCLRGYILSYFGEKHGEICSNCSNCLASTVQQDITRQAQMIFSCIQRMYRKLGYSLGPSRVAGVLHGSKASRILELHLDELTTYGVLSNVSMEQIQRMMEALESQGYLYTDPQHGGLMMHSKARGVLFEGEQVFMRVQKTEQTERNTEPTRRLPDDAEVDGALIDVLKQVRLAFARKEGVPLYVVFSNATLADMARKKPTTRAELLEVSGVGRTKAEKYGKAFLKAIKNYQAEKV